MTHIQFQDFARMDLRIGRVKEVSDHPDAQKLYVLRVDLGDREIQLVAGLKEHYSPQDLLEKEIVVVANLEPRSLRGIESQGMLLAAQCGETVSVLTVDRPVEAGSPVR